METGRVGGKQACPYMLKQQNKCNKGIKNKKISNLINSLDRAPL